MQYVAKDSDGVGDRPRTLWGRIEFTLYVAAPDARQRAVAVVDLDRFEVRPKGVASEKMEGFAEASAKYRLDIDFDFDRPLYMTFPRKDIFDESDKE